MSKPKPKPPGAADPLIAALIAKLPRPGSRWPAADRVAWLRMMAMGFAVVYGAEGDSMDDGLDIPQFLQRRPTPAPPASPKASAAPAAAPPKKAAKPAHLTAGCDYYVDAQGFARCDSKTDADGLAEPTPQRRVLAAEVEAGEPIYEYRTGPARDRDSIVWADDSAGALPGMAFCGPG